MHSVRHEYGQRLKRRHKNHTRITETMVKDASVLQAAPTIPICRMKIQFSTAFKLMRSRLVALSNQKLRLIVMIPELNPTDILSRPARLIMRAGASATPKAGGR